MQRKGKATLFGDSPTEGTKFDPQARSGKKYRYIGPRLATSYRGVVDRLPPQCVLRCRPRPTFIIGLTSSRRTACRRECCRDAATTDTQNATRSPNLRPTAGARGRKEDGRRDFKFTAGHAPSFRIEARASRSSSRASSSLKQRHGLFPEAPKPLSERHRGTLGTCPRAASSRDVVTLFDGAVNLFRPREGLVAARVARQDRSKRDVAAKTRASRQDCVIRTRLLCVRGLGGDAARPQLTRFSPSVRRLPFRR